MAKLADLDLGAERVGEDLDYAAIPEQMGAFAPPPQPGAYRFRLPTDMSRIWEPIELTTGKNPGKRLRARFDDSSPLTIVQSPGSRYDGDPFITSISNAERRRGRKDDPSAPEVSDMDYLLMAAFGLTKKPLTNRDYANALMAHAGQEFGADLTWSWRCREDKDIRVADDQAPGQTKPVEGTKGCGQRYYHTKIDKVPADQDQPNGPQVYPEHITCGQCGADLRAFASLERFRA